jgi:hypothetical protein
MWRTRREAPDRRSRRLDQPLQQILGFAVQDPGPPSASDRESSVREETVSSLRLTSCGGVITRPLLHPSWGDDPFTANRRLAFFTVDAPVRVVSGPVVPRASASVQPSRIVTVLTCNTRKGFCSSQVRASEQSAHRRYCVTLTQGSKASGPSISRTTLPKEISSGRLANWYPPLFPR